jgi:hypothetical protein
VVLRSKAVEEGRRKLLDLVLWSFVVALTPVVLGLAWKRIPWVVDENGLGLSRAFADAEPMRGLPYSRP